MRADDLIELVRTLEFDHGPGGWPAVEMATLSALADEVERLKDALHTANELYMDVQSKKDRATAAMYQFHYAMKDAGWHPGRTDDNLCDIIRSKGSELERLRSAAEKARAALSDLLATGAPIVYSDALAALDAVLGPNALKDHYGN